VHGGNTAQRFRNEARQPIGIAAPALARLPFARGCTRGNDTHAAEHPHAVCVCARASVRCRSADPRNPRRCAAQAADDGNRDFLTGGAAGKRPRGDELAPDDEPPEINPEDEFDLDDDDEAMYHDALAMEEQEISIPESSKKRWCRCCTRGLAVAILAMHLRCAVPQTSRERAARGAGS